jgi:hypothetical protein
MSTRCERATTYSPSCLVEVFSETEGHEEGRGFYTPALFYSKVPSGNHLLDASSYVTCARVPFAVQLNSL